MIIPFRANNPANSIETRESAVPILEISNCQILRKELVTCANCVQILYVMWNRKNSNVKIFFLCLDFLFCCASYERKKKKPTVMIKFVIKEKRVEGCKFLEQPLASIWMPDASQLTLVGSFQKNLFLGRRKNRGTRRKGGSFGGREKRVFRTRTVKNRKQSKNKW